MANGDVYGDVAGIIFKVRRPSEGQENDKTYFTLKSISTGKYVSCTLWDNSHGHVKVEDGDFVIVSGKVKKKEVDGKVFTNLSIFKIGVVKLDSGVRTDGGDDSGSGDEPDVM